MAIERLRLWNFRNHAESEFRPSVGTTVVVGPNGSGKSSLLEACVLFSTLASPRTPHASVLIRDGEPEGGARLEPDGGVPLEIRIRGGRMILRAGGSGTVAREFLGRFRAVLFTPEDLDLVRGEPELRRRAVDDLIVQLRPAYRGVRADFDRALRQRNAALRHGVRAEAEVYDAPLASAAAQILDARREVVQRLQPATTEIYRELAGRGEMQIRYRDTAGCDGRSGAALVEHLVATYRMRLERDLERGSTSVGPHRDDLEIEIDGHPARTHASRGEQRSAALGFRLAELRLLPGAVLLLDDVLSELDAERRRRVFEVAPGTQTIVTVTERGSIPEGVRVDALWTVKEGALVDG